MLERKQVETKNIRLRLRKFENDEEARKKKELDWGLEELKKGQQKLFADKYLLERDQQKLFADKHLLERDQASLKFNQEELERKETKNRLDRN